ncbi:MAG: hypothetical protein HRU34_16625 [Richelia sp.]|nr:hypothetical protein [Richelia sp.]
MTSQIEELVETQIAGKTDEVKDGNKGLIDAIKKRVQSEVQSAATITRETYLNAVKQAKETIEANQFIGCDSFGSKEYDIRIINDKSTTVVLTAKNVLDGIGL